MGRAIGASILEPDSEKVSDKGSDTGSDTVACSEIASGTAEGREGGERRLEAGTRRPAPGPDLGSWSKEGDLRVRARKLAQRDGWRSCPTAWRL